MCTTRAKARVGADNVNNLHSMYRTIVCLEYSPLNVVGK